METIDRELTTPTATALPKAGERYAPIDDAWATSKLPPVTRQEAERAANKIAARFGGVQHGGPHMDAPYRVRRIRLCWITRTGASTYKGWPRLVHDLSHQIFRARHPRWTPHHPAHARLEREITEFVLGAGWLAGSLRSIQAAPTREARSAEQAHAARCTARAVGGEAAPRDDRRAPVEATACRD